MAYVFVREWQVRHASQGKFKMVKNRNSGACECTTEIRISRSTMGNQTRESHLKPEIMYCEGSADQLTDVGQSPLKRMVR
jgi:hypothetical protein